MRTFDIIASRAGRRVEVSIGRTAVEVVEVTRTGQPVRTARFLASRVVAVVEHPMDDATADAYEPSGQKRSRPADENQASLGIDG